MGNDIFPMKQKKQRHLQIIVSTFALTVYYFVRLYNITSLLICQQVI